MHRLLRLFILFTVIVSLSGSAFAQGWRGLGRIAGKVTDESGAPIQGVTVKAFLPEEKGGLDVSTGKSGEWTLSGISRGLWQIDFQKDGYESRKITVAVSEMSRLPPVEIVLAKAASVVDPNVLIRERLLEANALIQSNRFAEARAMYDALIAAYPEAWQIHPLIARTYSGENQFDKAIEHLRLGLAGDPGNIEMTLLLGNILIEHGDAAEGRQLIESVDETRVNDPYTFVNVGIVLLNQDKPADALGFFDKAVTRFPGHPDAYYYRGLTHLQMDKTAEARADLVKFLELAPEAPEAALAKKILDQLK